MDGRNHHQGAVVADLRHVQAAVLGRYFHAEAAQFGQALHIFIGNLGISLDDAAVDGAEKLPQLVEERLGASLLGVGRLGEGVDELQRKATEKQLFGE